MKARAAALLAAVAILPGACNGQLRFDDVADGGLGSGDGAAEGPIEESPSERAAPLLCTADSDCKLATLHCDTVSGSCVPCLVDAHCTNAATPRCDAALHRCVQCGIAGDCPTGQTCEVQARRCVIGCSSLTGCINVTAPLCDLARGFCIRCLQDLECFQDNAGVCDTTDGQCVQCLTDAQCSGATPRCDVYAGVCLGCLTSADCAGATPLCDPSTGTCVGG